MIVFTPTYNRLELTKRTLETFYDRYDLDEPVHHIFVDNGSTDGTKGWLRSYKRASEVISLPQNLGIGMGHSIGMRAAELVKGFGDYVLVLENDWKCLRPCASWAKRVLDQHKDVVRVALSNGGREFALRVGGPDPKRRVEGDGETFWTRGANWTFRPGMVRQRAIRQKFPCRGEFYIQRSGKVVTAIPEGLFFDHLG